MSFQKIKMRKGISVTLLLLTIIRRYSFDVMSDTPSDGQVAATILAVPLQTLQPDESVAMSNSSLICLGANGNN